MKTTERVALCEQAIRILGKVHSSLSDAQHQCESCGADRYIVWDEANAKKQIEGAITRVTRAKENLRNRD